MLIEKILQKVLDKLIKLCDDVCKLVKNASEFKLKEFLKMNIDDKSFVEFMKILFSESYSIRYIDEAHCQSIEDNSFTVATIYSAFNYKHYNLEAMLEHIINEIRADYNEREIKHIIFRAGNAIICIKPWREF